ncbi:MAG: sodium:solute symporter family protein [Bacteriovoracaceae bacterium]|nr:sodium:solute symporter family protein [Bacteriovoracaceae bacterium]
MNSKIKVYDVMSSLDWTVFCVILLLTFLSVIYGHSLKKKTLKTDDEKESFLDLILMGRQLTLPMFVATLVATWYGGIFGVTAIAFEKGVYNFVTQGAFWYIAYLIFAFFLVDKIARYKAITLPDLIEQMFGPKSAKVCGVFNFFNVLPIVYTISLGLFLQLIFGGHLWQMMILGILIVVAYSMYGGFRAVVFSDIIQFFVMCLAVLTVLLLSLYMYGGPTFLVNNLPKQHFTLTGGESWATTFVWGFIALSTLVDPNFYQRVFAAKSSKVAKVGIIISTLIWFIFDICTTFGAMYAKAVIPQADSSYAYMIYAIQILPNGLRGFFMAGILATILSTLDSYLFLAGTTITYDLVPRKWKGKPLLHHIGIVFVGGLAIVLAIVFKGNIKVVWKTLGSYSASCLLLPVLYGHIFPRKISDAQFVFACICGVVATTYWRLVAHQGFLKHVDELYIGILATSLGLSVFAAMRHASRKKIL